MSYKITPPSKDELGDYRIIPPQEDLDFLDSLIFDPNAEPFFEELKASFIWPDEGFFSTLHGEGRDFLYDLFVARAYMYRSKPIGPNMQALWDYALKAIPQWPGFRRMHLSDLSEKDRVYWLECQKPRLEPL
jgi:hypothetical protein